MFLSVVLALKIIQWIYLHKYWRILLIFLHYCHFILFSSYFKFFFPRKFLKQRKIINFTPKISTTTKMQTYKKSRYKEIFYKYLIIFLLYEVNSVCLFWRKYKKNISNMICSLFNVLNFFWYNCRSICANIFLQFFSILKCFNRN